MENIPYKFLGYDLRKIQFEKNQTEELEEIRISVTTYNFDHKTNIVTIAIYIEIDYENSKGNHLIYSAGFEILDENLKQELDNNKLKNDFVSLFLRTVFPFIRESLMSITKDTGNPVLLPTINCLDINLDKTLVLTTKD